MSLRDSFDMDGRVAVVTGSGRGIGRAIAWGLADGFAWTLDGALKHVPARWDFEQVRWLHAKLDAWVGAER